MTTFRVNVNKLNLRSNPVTNFDNKGNVVAVLQKEAIFESVGVLENELGRWQVGVDGNCVSEKWLENLSTESQELFDSSFDSQDLKKEIDNYLNIVKQQIGDIIFQGYDGNKMNTVHKELLIPYLWEAMSTKGEMVNIALIDCGIDNSHEDLKQNVIAEKSRSFIEGDDENDFLDYSGHGTCCAGLISGSGQKEVIGIAPASKLFSLKIYDGFGFKKKQNKEETLLAAFNWIKELDKDESTKIDIVSMSFSISEDFPSLERELISLCGDKVLLAASNNEGNDIATPGYPSDYKSVLSIGSLNNELDILPNCRLSDNLKFLTFGESLNTTNSTLIPGSSDKIPFSDTSASTAIMAGLFALFISWSKKNHMNLSVQQLIELFTDNSFDKNIMSDESIKDISFPFPLKAYLAKKSSL